MNPAFTVVDIQQGTPAWLEWRRQGIGASDAPAIMGENPWKSAAHLLAEKQGFVKEFSGNAAMARGTALEPEARSRYETIRGIRVSPACLQSKNHDWLRASVDGLSVNGGAVVEIKCGESVYKKTASSRQVPRYYVGQLQHILAVTDFDEIDFFCWLPRLPEIHLCIKRDERYIDRLISAEQTFWRQLSRR